MNIASVIHLEEVWRWLQNGKLGWSSDVGQHTKMVPAVGDVAWKIQVFLYQLRKHSNVFETNVIKGVCYTFIAAKMTTSTITAIYNLTLWYIFILLQNNLKQVSFAYT